MKKNRKSVCPSRNKYTAQLFQQTLKNNIIQIRIIFWGIICFELMNLPTFCNKLSAQTIPRVRLFGKVTDAATGKPLHYANVFLANTTKGSATRNAKKCKIVNPEVLDFEYDQKYERFTAKASQALQIENHALGYRIELYLMEFGFRDFFKGKYLCKSKYDLLSPKNKKEEEKWKKNRLKAYNGSLRHFITALVSRSLNEEGFFVQSYTGIQDRRELILPTEINIDSLLSPGEFPFERTLSFPDYLKVTYTREETSPEFPGYNVKDRFQKSWLKILYGNSATVTTSGLLNDPLSVMTAGYFGWERFANSLPLDFTPSSQASCETLSPFSHIDFLNPSDSLPDRSDTPARQDESLIDPVILLKKARTLALKENVREATMALYTGLQSLGNRPYADTMYQEIVDIATDEEQNPYREATNKGQHLHNFWQRQDPTLATLENERFVEHTKRYEYAKKFYPSTQEPRGYDDRGRIYIRYGPPYDLVRIPFHRSLYPNEGWFYSIRGSEVMFDFVNRRGRYQLVSNPSEMIAEEKTLSIEDELDDIAKTRESLPINPDLYRRMDKYIENISKQTQFQNIVTSDLSQAEKPLEYALNSARFHRGEKTRLEIYFGIPCSQLILDQSSDEDSQTELHVAYAIRDSSSILVVQKNLQRTIRVPPGSSPQNQLSEEHLVKRHVCYMEKHSAFDKSFKRSQSHNTAKAAIVIICSLRSLRLCGG